MGCHKRYVTYVQNLRCHTPGTWVIYLGVYAMQWLAKSYFVIHVCVYLVRCAMVDQASFLLSQSSGVSYM